MRAHRRLADAVSRTARPARLAAGQGRCAVRAASAIVAAHHRIPLRRHRLVLAAAYRLFLVRRAVAPVPSSAAAPRAPVPGTAAHGRRVADVLQRLPAQRPAPVQPRGAGSLLPAPVPDRARPARHGDLGALLQDRADRGQAVVPPGPDRFAADRRERRVLPERVGRHARAGTGADGAGAVQDRCAGRRREVRAVGPAGRETDPRRAGAGSDPGPSRQLLFRPGSARAAVRAHAQGAVYDALCAVRH